MWAIRTISSRSSLLRSGACALLIDYTESLAYQRYIGSQCSAYARQRGLEATHAANKRPRQGLVPHPIQARKYLRGVAASRPGPRRTLEVPAEVLVWICRPVARAVGCLHGVEGLVDLLFWHALYLGTDVGDDWRSGREVAHDGEDRRRRVTAPFAEDIGALLAHEDGRAREAAEDGHGIVRMPEKELALLELEQFFAGRARERAVAGVGEFLVADAAVETRGGVAYNLVVDLAPELLGPEKREVEMPTPRRNIHQRVLQGRRAGVAGRGVLVQLVDEEYELVHPEPARLRELPDLRYDARHDEVLGHPGELGDVHDTHLVVLERAVRARQVAVLDAPVHQEAPALVREYLEAVLHLGDRHVVVAVPGRDVLAICAGGLEVVFDLIEQRIEVRRRPDAPVAQLLYKAAELVVHVGWLEDVAGVGQHVS